MIDNVNSIFIYPSKPSYHVFNRLILDTHQFCWYIHDYTFMIERFSDLELLVMIIKVNILQEIRRENVGIFSEVQDVERKTMESMDLFPTY